jgi:hypothetical protein
MAATYEHISTQTLSVATADIFFNSIPQTYTDLVLVMTGGCTVNAGVGHRLNSNNTTSYGVTFFEGNGTTATTNRTISDTYMRVGWVATWSTTLVNSLVSHFQDYSNSTTFKNVTTQINDFTNGAVGISTACFRNTSAITSINIMTSSGTTYLVGSTFSLYGIKAA